MLGLALTLALLPLLGATAQAAPLTQRGQRISFARGATGATVEGFVSPTQPARYVLRALRSQVMTVQSWYSDAPVQVTIYDNAGGILGTAGGRRQWTDTLPYTGDYYLTVATPYDEGSNFGMHVEIVYAGRQPQPAPQPAVDGERIRFAAGKNNATVNGALVEGGVKRYVLSALQGQLISVQTWVEGGAYRFTVAGADGRVLGSADGGSTWAGSLPATQDYVITLESTGGGRGSQYWLTVAISTIVQAPAPTPVPNTTPDPAHARAIRFAPGESSTTVWDTLAPGQPKQYVLWARAGQTMSLALVTGGATPARVTVLTANGASLGGLGQGEQWQGALPYSGDYFLHIQSPADVEETTISLWVGIR
jgi:hypothetical protein